MSWNDRINQIADYINQICRLEPTVAMIPGTGLGDIYNQMEVLHQIPYSDIPNMPTQMQEGHQPQLYLGRYRDTNILIFGGRFHRYEGYRPKEVCIPVYVSRALGCRQLFMSNISGSLQSHLREGDIMVISDHINLQGDNPLSGPNDDMLGPRFPDMSNIYDLGLRKKAHSIISGLNIAYLEGVYASMMGPSLETKAEYQFLHNIGADLIGMSTVPEAIVASYLNMPVFCLSLVVNNCHPVQEIEVVDVPKIMNLVAERKDALQTIFLQMIERL